MEVTNAMVHAAIKQAVKDKILPAHTYEEFYIHHWDSMKRIIEAAIEKQGQHI